MTLPSASLVLAHDATPWAQIIMWWEALLRNRPVVLTHPDPNILGCLLEVSGGGGHVYRGGDDAVVMPMKVFFV